MPIYNAPVKDIKFVLNDLLGVDKMTNMPGFEDATPDMVDAILTEGAKLMSEVIQPLNQVGDSEGCTWNDGDVKTPTGFKEAYDEYRQAGWMGLDADPDYGGQGLPHVIGIAFAEMMSSANMAFGMYPGLTHGAYASIHRHGTDEQKQTWLPKMVTGDWTGTMNLTEPHCGTDLGLMRTKAVPQEDGSYKVSGTKIFISAGEHDMSDNIVHLVLAKIPGGPEGIKGVSLFIVPKFILDADGNPGDRNGVACGSIEHKMGIHGNSTCVMNYDDATGYLLGDAHKGMRAMFTMMNAARLGVGIQGLSQAEVAYQNAVVYAKDRLQGRSISGVKAPEKAADPIIVHPDIRRNLMMIRAFTEGARALGLWAGLQVDMVEKHPEADGRKAADEALGLLTPVIKAYFTDMGFDLAATAMQCFGGHGYIHEWGMEQFVRDARITQIYEGANGVQALDLVGRKLPQNLGRNLRQFFHPVDAFIQENMMDPEMKDYVMPLAKAFAKLQQGTALLGEKGMKNPDEAGAASTEYLRMFGLVALGFMWAQMAKIAKQKLAEGTDDPQFFETKLVTARFFFERMIPDVSSLLVKMSAGSNTMMELDAEAF
ncbi:acyl-CoA dehydrogenase C-terminal domain-containing protein [Sneathiella marina]|uniref:Acyl-CoA dehydrogenase C-terminal domain-containing protein n=1 Tax=Sneathiella marina TaxID=2950108 RepID=A0ABY4W936_9PROT|nr:acyl-CoA dehydrogenase C-terminal domain-containing protein [Sneathiella marina]USG61789.1 acyl-CoA dehydrogenase C-terminal domain-containing protein [Sneathiella marina]